MHLLAMVVVAVLVHVALVRVRVGLVPLVAASVLVVAVVGVVVRPSSLLENGLGAAAVLLAALTGVVRRQTRIVVEALAHATWHPSSAHDSGDEFVRALQEHGFAIADDGWARAEGIDWSLVALQRGPVRALVVSGAHGPTMEASTVLDNGRVLLTAPSARDRVAPHVVRQCFPSTDALELVDEHELALEAAVSAGRLPVARRFDDLTATALAEEVAHGQQLLQGGIVAALGSLWRELTRTERDLGAVTERPDAWARLVTDPT